jgi:hypothetical protein
MTVRILREACPAPVNNKEIEIEIRSGRMRQKSKAADYFGNQRLDSVPM